MKQKNILFASTFSLFLLVIVTASWYRYEHIKPISQQPPINETPIISYSNEDQQAVDSRPAMTDDDKAQADQPGEKQPTVTIPREKPTQPDTPPATNAPKQEEIRKSITKEQTYYPLRSANDPGYADNWAVQKVNAPAAWDISTGNGQTIVAVIDTGFGLNHEDLKNSWHTNANEMGITTLGDRCWTGIAADKTANNCDDDNNGYVDDWRGWDFSLSDNNPMTGLTNPSGAAVAHGTEVAGLIGASGNNATGITTINWNTKIMPLQALSDDGPGYTSDVAAAVYYAVDNGADVINMSLGGNEHDPALEQATDYAFAHDVIVVAAAGNCGSMQEGCEGLPPGFMGYPALNDHVIAVGATNAQDQRASFSSYGPGLDVMAPGSGTIVSPTWTASDGVSLYSGALYGTSYASPQVASLASLIKSVRSDSSADDVTALLLATTSKLPDMNGAIHTNTLGHGMVNAATALTIATSLNTTTATPTLLQAGGAITEHRFASTDSLGSGCVTTADTYCTIWMRSSQSDYERYLPYKKANLAGQTGWTWRGTTLQSGDWQIRAVQGDNYSTSYTLGSK